MKVCNLNPSMTSFDLRSLTVAGFVTISLWILGAVNFANTLVAFVFRLTECTPVGYVTAFVDLSHRAELRYVSQG